MAGVASPKAPSSKGSFVQLDFAVRAHRMRTIKVRSYIPNRVQMRLLMAHPVCRTLPIEYEFTNSDRVFVTLSFFAVPSPRRRGSAAVELERTRVAHARGATTR